MNKNGYDIIIIGSGMSGLYSAYNIKQMSPNTSFMILEKYKREWIGGRASNYTFYGTEVVTGAGVGRFKKDKLLYQLLQHLRIKTTEFTTNQEYSSLIDTPEDIVHTTEYLQKEYNKHHHHKHNDKPNITFKQFAQPLLGEKKYTNFIISTGFRDYENEDAYETLFHYGLEDDACCWKAFSVPWKKMVLKLADTIGKQHFKFSNKVVQISTLPQTDKVFNYRFKIITEQGAIYYANKVIVATTISGIRSLLPKFPIYKSIEGQPFLRLYGKFSKSSIPIIQEYVKSVTIVPGPLQKIIPIDSNKGVYMIAYNDNKNTITLSKRLENTEENRHFFCKLIEKSLGISSKHTSLHLIAIKDFYWPIGTHYYKPLDNKLYSSREEFIYKAQHPLQNMLVVGEVVSRNQGWTEGALESVKSVLTKKWIQSV